MTADANDKSGGVREAIRKMRKSAGMTQDGLAKVVGVERTSITNIEAGKQTVSVALLRKIVDACGYGMKISLTKKVTHEC